MSQPTSDTLLLQNYAMLRILCHDVANTLSIIQLTCRQLSQPPVLASEKAPVLIDRIIRTTDAQKNLLLNAKALGAYITEFEPSAKDTVDLRDVADRVIQELSELALQKTLRVSLEADPDAPYYVFGHRFAIETLIFRALIANAIKYSFPGDTIAVRLFRDGEGLCLTITDRGLGIKEVNVPYIFEHGKVALGEGTQGERGMGLGLFLLKFLCDRTGVQVGVTSRHRDEVAQGHGTTFTLRFEAA